MSTKEQKIEVISEFLERNARLQRLTNLLEVQIAAGLELAVRGYREGGSCHPLSRDKVAEALTEIARVSWQEAGFLLPALVVHFGDKQPGHRFVAWAGEAGLIKLPEFDPDSTENEVNLELDDNGVPRWDVIPEVLSVHADQVAQVFTNYAPASV